MTPTARAKPAPQAVAPAPAPPVAAAPAAEAPAGMTDPCQAARFAFGSVSKACKDGGRKAVKPIMKGAVSKAKAAGTDLTCKSCHTDTSSYHLKPNAIADLKLWL